MIKLNCRVNFTGKPTESAIDYPAFIERAGYPPPYKNQIRMFDFIFNKPWRSQVKMILGARGYGKTDYVTLLGSAHKIAEDAGYKIIHITKEQTRGQELIAEAREILKRNDITIKNRSKKAIIVAGHVGKDPNLINIPVRGRGMRGRHVNLAIMDDPITPEDDSAAERKRVRRVYEELTKVAPHIVIIGQPVHKLDLYQELRGLVDKIELIYGEIPELDADLDAQRKAGVSEKSIQASYFLKIEDDLSMPFLKMEIVDSFPLDKSTVAFIDPAAKGGQDRDTTAITIGRMAYDNFIVVGFSWKRAWEDTLEDLKTICNKYRVGLCFFEDNICGSEPIKRLNQLGLNTRPHTAKGNKHGRIMRLAIHSDTIKLYKPTDLTTSLLTANADYIKMVREYEYGSDFDDAPDSLAGLMEKVGLIRSYDV